MTAQLGNPGGFTDDRQTQGVKTSPVGTPANYATVSSREARLTAINPTYYTAARLRQMTENDKTYAIRQADDAAGIN